MYGIDTDISVVAVPDVLVHHGIAGQRWGDKNGPPYPLDSGDHSSSEKSAAKKHGIKVGGSVKDSKGSGVAKRMYEATTNKIKKVASEVKDNSDKFKARVQRSKEEHSQKQHDKAIASGNINYINNNYKMFSSDDMKAALQRRATIDQVKDYNRQKRQESMERLNRTLNNTKNLVSNVYDLSKKVKQFADDREEKESKRKAKENDKLFVEGAVDALTTKNYDKVFDSIRNMSGDQAVSRIKDVQAIIGGSGGGKKGGGGNPSAANEEIRSWFGKDSDAQVHNAFKDPDSILYSSRTEKVESIKAKTDYPELFGGYKNLRVDDISSSNSSDNTSKSDSNKSQNSNNSEASKQDTKPQETNTKDSSQREYENRMSRLAEERGKEHEARDQKEAAERQRKEEHQKRVAREKAEAREAKENKIKAKEEAERREREERIEKAANEADRKHAAEARKQEEAREERAKAERAKKRAEEADRRERDELREKAANKAERERAAKERKREEDKKLKDQYKREREQQEKQREVEKRMREFNEKQSKYDKQQKELIDKYLNANGSKVTAKSKKASGSVKVESVKHNKDGSYDMRTNTGKTMSSIDANTSYLRKLGIDIGWK